MKVSTLRKMGDMTHRTGWEPNRVLGCPGPGDLQASVVGVAFRFCLQNLRGMRFGLWAPCQVSGRRRLRNWLVSLMEETAIQCVEAGVLP